MRLLQRQRLVQLCEAVLGLDLLRFLGRLLPPAGPQLVDAQAPGERPDPGPHGGVVAQLVQALVGAGEDLLEDVLGVVLGQPVHPRGDRVDVA